MKALDPGIKAPQIELPLIGGGKFSLAQALSEGRVLLAFFKISCPVCQYTFPFLERLAKRAEGRGLKVVGISQDDAKSTKVFCDTYGITFATALDGLSRYPVSNAYGLTNVPTTFLIGQDGHIEQTIVGWSRDEIEAIDREYSNSQNAKFPLFPKGEEVSPFRAG